MKKKSNKGPKEEKEMTRGAKKDKSSKKSKPGDNCPHGHKFGVDCEKHEICDDCDEWDPCLEEKEKLEKK